MALNERSLSRLNGVHPDLAKVIKAASEKMPLGDLSFQISEGVRTAARQKELVAAGKSQTMNSRHIPTANGYGHAVDIVVYDKGAVTWHFPCYGQIAAIIKATAAKLGIPVEWGGDWKSFKDGPHFQLSASKYPGNEKV